MLTETQISDVWVMFTDFIDKKQLEAAAERYVELLADYGVSDLVLAATTGIDETLDKAIEYYLDEDEIDDDEDSDYQELEF
jgi:hypothetical protein